MRGGIGGAGALIFGKFGLSAGSDSLGHLVGDNLGPVAPGLDGVELGECVPSVPGADQVVEDRELVRLINRFLYTLPERDCGIFLRRYWYVEPLENIAGRYGLKENTVKSSLFRTRKKLRAYLEKEGIDL